MSQPTTLDLTGTWDLDPAHTRLGFAARHAMVATVRGNFHVFSGVIHLDHADPSKSSAEVDIDAASISTSNDQRDAHLKSADFLDVEKYPTITFRSSRAEVVDDENYKLYGDLVVRDQARPVVLNLEFQGSAVDPFGNTRAGFEGKTTVNRKDWGLTWNVAIEGGGILVGDKVKIELDVSAIKRPEAPAADA
ncbi:MAG TPA: YceI family protein [Mycobacteriales bacterium]|nr:YceI family protein [Mycobacteriales bacterium]